MKNTIIYFIIILFELLLEDGCYNNLSPRNFRTKYFLKLFPACEPNSRFEKES